MQRLRSRLVAFGALCAIASTAACASNASSASVDAVAPKRAVRYDPAALPSGPVGAEIKLGHDIIVNPKKYLPHNVVADITCEQCHLQGGTVDRAGTFAGVYGRFPQWNKRSKRVIMLQDRIAECFLYSENGTPPAYASKEMIAIAAYIAYLSKGVPVGQPQDKAVSFLVPVPSASPDARRGGELYAQKCAACHRADGQGIAGQFPPLWGSRAFNSGAGMAHIDRMAGFVRYNMPANAPGSLSLDEAYDISAWVLARPRPKFDPARVVTQPSESAKYF